MRRPTSELDDFDYLLPPEQIARRPAPARDESRLMVVDRELDTPPRDHGFGDLIDMIDPRDLLVFNDTRVLPARLPARKVETGGRVEVLLVEPRTGPTHWLAMVRSSKGVRLDTRLQLEGRPELELRVVSVEGEGFVELEMPTDGAELARELGEVPLPPYLGRPADDADRERYQTVYARSDRAASVAAPTAGLHFTTDLLERLRSRGVSQAKLTLDVGPGTFLPVKAASLAEHRMHVEQFELPASTVEAIHACRARGGRVVAVGTTTVRVLESQDELVPGSGSTGLFIRPGHTFRWVDQMITNFHLPRSTLLVLVSAFAGRTRMLSAYQRAVERGYRFYSYGDAMWIR